MRPAVDSNSSLDSANGDHDEAKVASSEKQIYEQDVRRITTLQIIQLSWEDTNYFIRRRK